MAASRSGQGTSPIITPIGCKFGLGALGLGGGTHAVIATTDNLLDLNPGTGDMTLDYWVDNTEEGPFPQVLFTIWQDAGNYNQFLCYRSGPYYGDALGVACKRGGAWAMADMAPGVTFPGDKTHIAFIRRNGAWAMTVQGQPVNHGIYAGDPAMDFTLSAPVYAALDADRPVDEFRFSFPVARWKIFPFTVPAQAYGPGYNGMPLQTVFEVTKIGAGSIYAGSARIDVGTPLNGVYIYNWERNRPITMRFVSITGAPAPYVSIYGYTAGTMTEYAFADPIEAMIPIQVTFSGVPQSVQISGAELFTGANGIYEFEDEMIEFEDEWSRMGRQFYRKDASWKLERSFALDKQSNTIYDNDGYIMEGAAFRYVSYGSGYIGTDIYWDADTLMTDSASGALV